MRSVLPVLLVVGVALSSVLACEDGIAPAPAPGLEFSVLDAGANAPVVVDPGAGASDDAGDAGRVLPDGLLEPIPYTSRADSPFVDVRLATYAHFEDWEDGVLDQPGVVASSSQLGSAFGAALVDSVDGDDGVVDGVCSKTEGCNSAFGNGTIDFVFDAAALGGQLPTHVGIVWTDGSPGASAIFEAYDANDVLIGTKTADAVGDGSNNGTVDEDRHFGIVHGAGVKKIVVKSSSGGVEVDHLFYAR